MSAKLMGQVWEIELPHNEQTVMLALADHGEDDGTQIFPSVDRLVWKTGYKERQVQNILRSLETKGLIEPVAYARGGRGHATEYKMNIEKGAKKPPFEKGAKSERVQNPAQRVQSTTVKGAKSSTKGATVIAPQPSEKHQLKPSIEPSKGKAADAAPPSKPVTFEDIQAVPTEARKPTQQQAEVAAWGEVMELDIHIPANANRVGNMLKGLRKSKDCPPVVEVARFRFGRTPPPDASWNFYSHTWQGERGQPPTEREINQYWGAWLKPALKVVNGSNGNARAAPMSRSDRNRQILDEAMAEALGQSPPTGGAIVEGRVIRGHAS